MRANTPGKRKRVSKKNKKSWRKHTDDSDVEAFLNRKRLEERLGTCNTEKKDEQLFVIDNVPQNRGLRNQKNKRSNDVPLRCYQGLENTSAVPDPLIKRNRVRTKIERQHPILKQKNEERIKKGLLKKKESVHLQKIFKKRIRDLISKPKRKIQTDLDLWNDYKEQSSKIYRLDTWLNENTLLHNIRGTRGIKELSNYRPKKPKTVIPAFETPDPGISYNPTFVDHINLMNKVANKELEEQKKESHLHRVTNPFYQKISLADNQKMWLQEMSQGLPIASNVTENDQTGFVKDGDVDEPYKPINPPVSREKKKTIKQRKKELRLKREQSKRNETEQERKKRLDICRIKHIQCEIEEEESKMEQRVAKRLRKRLNKVNESRRVCKNKFDEGMQDFNLVAELTGSLREVLPQGNILKDRFLNLQKRNVIEVLKPQFGKLKKKVKKYRAASHRIEPVELPANEVMKNVRKRKTAK